MRKFIDLVDKKFGRLTVIKEYGKNRHGLSKWLCKCDCGNEVIVWGNHLKAGNTKSCGCLQKEIARKNSTKHGCCKERIYTAWANMKNRCHNEKHPEYKYYGGKGVKVCEEWLHDFQSFHKWAMANGYAENLTIDRIDNNGNYTPSNCRWTTWKEQQNNRSNNALITYKEETKTLAQWAETTGIAYYTLWQRINTLHWNTEEALTRHKERAS